MQSEDAIKAARCSALPLDVQTESSLTSVSQQLRAHLNRPWITPDARFGEPSDGLGPGPTFCIAALLIVPGLWARCHTVPAVQRVGCSETSVLIDEGIPTA